MANVAHSTLTGSNLHEPKGIAAQTAGKVYVSDGAASGAWTSLAGAQNPFGSALLHVTYQGSTFTAPINTTFARVLDTVPTNEIVGASLVSDQITLPSGTYYVDGYSSVMVLPTVVSGFVGYILSSNLFNVTGGSPALFGMSSATTLSANTQDTFLTYISGRITFGSTSVFEFRHNLSVSPASTSAAQSAQNSSIAASIRFWKIA